MNNNMDTDERAMYMKAIRGAGTAKAFDRVLHLVTVGVFIAVASYVVWQQAVYQTNMSNVSRERTEQYKELRISQEQIRQASTELKQYIACLKRLPVQPDEALITICEDNIKGD